MTSRPKVYWDACVFVSHLDNRDKSRSDAIRSFIESIMDGRSRPIFTSTLSKVEVAYLAEEKDRGTLDPAVLAKIDSLWGDFQTVRIVEIHDYIADKARGFLRQAMRDRVKLRPNDAVHLATASYVGADEFHTYDKFDGNASGVEKIVGLKICEPYVLEPRLPEM